MKGRYSVIVIPILLFLFYQLINFMVDVYQIDGHHKDEKTYTCDGKPVNLSCTRSALGFWECNLDMCKYAEPEVKDSVHTCSKGANYKSFGYNVLLSLSYILGIILVGFLYEKDNLLTKSLDRYFSIGNFVSSSKKNDDDDYQFHGF